MFLKFTSEVGTLIFGADDMSTSFFRLTAAEGLSFPEKSFSAAVYANTRGQKTVGTYVGPRTITLSGDVLLTQDTAHALSEAAHILDKPGTLEIHFDDRKPRKIDCSCSAFVPGMLKRVA